MGCCQVERKEEFTIMKIKTKRILGAVLATATVMGMAGTTSAYAASSISGKVNGVSCSGSVKYVKTPAGVPNGVQATTYLGGAGSVQVTAIVCYKFNNVRYVTPVSNTGTAGAVSATAHTNDTGNVYGGKGKHNVTCGSDKWENKTTSIGTTW